ncbi:MAG: D-cysteine desulfhydrase family protein [Chloroflexota bacterium]
MRTTSLPRLPIASLPTPIEPLPRLSAALGGPQLWIKRDDLTGLAFGGNKTRKLEFLLADARAGGARTLLTTGAVQSNHCRQTAAAAARFGFDCILVLAGHAPTAPADWTGNLLLDHLLGAEIRWVGNQERDQVLAQAFNQVQAEGRRPYLIPYGGSNALGASAYAYAVEELLDQGEAFDRIVVASSSGGTQAGLVAGARLHGYGGRISGISVDQVASVLRARVASLAGETAVVLGQRLEVVAEEVEVFDEYLGGGYGVMGEAEREAIALFARHEGILLDPVYTGRAAAGMIDLIRRGVVRSEERVLFWHTGGTPALFAYAALRPRPG